LHILTTLDSSFKRLYGMCCLWIRQVTRRAHKTVGIGISQPSLMIKRVNWTDFI